MLGEQCVSNSAIIDFVPWVGLQCVIVVFLIILLIF